MGNVTETQEQMQAVVYGKDSKVKEVINNPDFEDYGRLIFPVDIRIPEELALKDVEDVLPWYSEEEKKADPAKKNTGLFFFCGTEGGKSAIVNSGGGFVYVAGIHDSFPHALELSKKGYNAFALIYRPDAQSACEDLARAIVFLQEHEEELQIDMTGYSLWGGSAGARMAAWLGSYGTAYFGEKDLPAPACVIMQYTGLSQITGNEPPTYACVGTNDGIAYYRGMENYISRISDNGTNAKIEVFQGLSHGFGLGEGTVAEGWLDHAIEFWESNMEQEYELKNNDKNWN